MAEQEKYVTRTVKGPKNYSGFDKDGNRVIHPPGSTIEVSARAARAFAHQLVDPAVAAAQAEAARVEAEAAAEADEAAKVPPQPAQPAQPAQQAPAAPQQAAKADK